MRDDWELHRLGDLVEIYDGPHATPSKVNAGPIFLGISNLVGGRLNLSETEHISEEDYVRWTRRVTPQVGDVVFSYETRLGEAALIPDGLRCCLGRRMGLLRPHRETIDPRFLHYAYLGPEFQETLRARTIRGSTVDRIPLIEMPNFPIRIPNLNTQRAVAYVLGNLDDKIDLNYAMSMTLDNTARALFKSWFVNFDPVHAKADGRETRLPKFISSFFPSSFEETEYGECPKSWVFKSLPEVVEINPSRTLGRGEASPYLDMANVPTQGHSPLKVVDRPFSSGMRFSNGDTLVARITPCLENGKTAFVDFLKKDQVGWGSTEYIVLRPKPPLPEEYGYCLARSPEFREFAIHRMTGSSGRQRVPVDSLDDFFVPSPTPDVATSFGKLVKPLFGRAKAAIDQNCVLTSVRNALLPKLISGEVQIRDAERIVGSRF